MTKSNFIVLCIAMCVAALVGLVLTPRVIAFAKNHGIVDRPGGRKIHDEPIPVVGGVSIYVAFVVGMLILFCFSSIFDGNEGRFAALMIGGTIMWAIGLIDDQRELSAGVKLLGQCAAILVVVLFGYQIDHISHFLGSNRIDLGIFAVPVTFLWFLVIINAINLIDGLDGLAGSISIISSLSVAAVAFLVGAETLFAAVCALILSVSVVGFLVYNIHPAKTFMGDSGSLFLGFVIAFVTMQGLKTYVAVPLLLVAIPIFDVVAVIFRRLKAGAPVFKGDRRHLHHRLLERGFSQMQVLGIITALTLCFAIVGVLVPYIPWWVATLALVLLVVILCIL